MALLKELKGSFVGGQVSPELQNRIDLEKFNTFVKEAKNTQIKPEGGISNRAGTIFIGNAKDSTFRLTINSNQTSTIIINGVIYKNVTTKSVDIEVGSAYSYSVGASGYKVVSANGILNENKVIDVELEASADTYTFTIDNGSQGATITINGTEQSSITASEGTLIEWEVSKTGYISQSGAFLLTETETIEVELEGDTSFTLTITAYPSTSNIRLVINGTDTYTGQTTVSATVQQDDTYSYTVSCNDYTDETGSGTVSNDDINISVTLQRTSYSVSNITTENLSTGITSLFRYNINKNGQYSIDIKGETGVLYEGGNTYYSGSYIWTGKGGTAIGSISLNAGQIVEIKAIKGGFESFKYGGVQTTYVGGCGIGVWVDDTLILVVGGGAVEDSDYYRYGYTIGGGGYNGGNSKSIINHTRQEQYCGYSYNGLKGNNETENNGSGGKTSNNAYGGSGYVDSDYSSYFTLTKNTNQAKASASITFVG